MLRNMLLALISTMRKASKAKAILKGRKKTVESD
jgi:hypothetical protein